MIDAKIISYHQDNNRKFCFYCGVLLCGKPPHPNGATQDHVNPIANGGRDNFHNLVSCCFLCNHKKGCMSPELFRKQQGPIFWGEQQYLKMTRRVRKAMNA